MIEKAPTSPCPPRRPLCVGAHRHRPVLGVPLLYAYLFTSWALLIALVALVVRRAG